MAQKFTNRKGKIRFYDGTAVTPRYLEIDFDAGDISGPIGNPLADEIIVTDRGTLDSNTHHITGPEDKILEPQSVSFSFFCTDLNKTDLLLDYISAMNDGGTTTVDSLTMATTKGGSTRGGITTPAFADSNKLACDVQYLLEAGTTDFGYEWAECWFPIDQATISEGEDAVTVSLTGMCYGAISRITSFTSGTALA
jgi:hypothetical protein